MKYLPFLFAFFLLIVSVSALQIPSTQLIPSNISVNSSFLLVADMGSTADSIRLIWYAPGIVYGQGSIPKTGDKYICYFSNSDPASTCGPNPFTEKSVWAVNIDAVNQNGETSNTTVNIPVGGIKLNIRIDQVNNTLYIRVSPSGSFPDSVSYAIYNTNLSVVKNYAQMTYEADTGRYSSTVSLNPGEYYIIFSAVSSTDFGGGVQRIKVPSAVQPGLPGVCGEGGTAGITADAVRLNVLLSGDSYQKANFKISNTLSYPLTDLSVKPIENLSNYIDIILQKTSLEPNETSYFTVKLSNITSAMGINANFEVWNGTATLGYIPVNISISVIGKPGVVAVANVLDISPDPIISESSISSLSKEFTLTNRGSATITNITTSVGSGLEAVATVSAPSSISAGGSQTVSVALSPITGRHRGTITISTSAGSKQILVDVEFYRDISSDIDAKILEAEELLNKTPSSFKSLVESVKTDLETAKTYFSGGSYGSAEKEYSAAISQLSVLSDVITATSPTTTDGVPSGAAGADATGIIIVLVILVIAVAGFFFIRKVRKKRPGEEEEIVEEV